MTDLLPGYQDPANTFMRPILRQTADQPERVLVALPKEAIAFALRSIEFADLLDPQNVYDTTCEELEGAYRDLTGEEFND